MEGVKDSEMHNGGVYGLCKVMLQVGLFQTS